MSASASYVGDGFSSFPAVPGNGGTTYIDSGAQISQAIIDPSGSVFGVGDHVAWSIGGSSANVAVFAGVVLVAGTEYPVLTYGGNYYAIGLSATASGVFSQQSLACFCAGTRILTPSGPVPVEALRVGDLVLTHAGEARALCWTGRRHIVDPTAGQRPVRVRAHCFSPGVPQRDLWLSPEHALFCDGVLIPVQCLLNGASVAQVAVAEVTYFHLEFGRHEVILAEGVPCESLRDEAELAVFDTSHGLRPAVAHEPCAPIRTQGPVVEAVRLRLGQLALAA